MAASKSQAFWNHPAGPKTIHFWAPAAKWVLTIANIADFSKPPEKISYPQQLGPQRPQKGESAQRYSVSSEVSKSSPEFRRGTEGRETDPQMAGSKLKAFWNHPAGPKTIFFWAPTVKWGVSLANISDFSKPPESLSYPQQAVILCTGLVWSRYSLVVIPRNWNLFGNSFAMAGTGLYQLTRKITHDCFPKTQAAAEAQA
ncbi:Mitochondrial pyruvate carrier 2 [Morella rubra]|uniref:Mitochondrial pyruvate carrier n=1 Tax=Morella rubra TaxID=262757 RepID=A0A6A1VQS8_9ROSI|nr:Mitochondrial pyruvate carrier 2 [Morella rubra]